MASPTLSFRPAGPADEEPLLALIAEYYATDHIAFDAPSVRRGLSALLADGALGRIHLLEWEGQNAGYVVFTFGFDFEFGGRLATITDLFIQPRLRRQGLASQTLQLVAQECRSLGVQALQLEVEQHNLAAKALYEKFGFRLLTRFPMLKRL